MIAILFNPSLNLAHDGVANTTNEVLRDTVHFYQHGFLQMSITIGCEVLLAECSRGPISCYHYGFLQTNSTIECEALLFDCSNMPQAT